MLQDIAETQFLAALTRSYEEDPEQYVTLPKPMVDSSEARLAIAQLRNEGYVEEEIRGVVRLTARGYKALQEGSPQRGEIELCNLIGDSSWIGAFQAG